MSSPSPVLIEADVVPGTVSTAPFVVGKVLKWSAGGQTGTIVVTAVDGSTFRVDQKNARNPEVGITQRDGEVRDGKFYIHNRKWNETWVGVYADGKVCGKINNFYPFQISE